MGILLGWSALYGVGTAVEMTDYRERWPRSIAARSVSQDAADWPEFAATLQVPPGAVAYTVGYSYAAQVQFYSGVPTFTNVPQLGLWGIPSSDVLTVILAGDLPDAAVDAALRRDFAEVAGPTSQDFSRKRVRVWQAAGRRVPYEDALRDLDYLRLANQTWGSIR